MKGQYFGVFYRDTFVHWSVASTARRAKREAMQFEGCETWAKARKIGYRIGKVKITEIVPEPTKSKRKKVKA